MKRLLSFVLAVSAVVVLAGNNLYSAQQGAKKQKSIVVYYSYSGNTKNIAETIKELTGSDILEIKPVTAYSSDYNTVVKQAKKENADGFKTPIQAINKDISSYDIIYLGTPVWWYTMASPVRTFLSQNDMSGKTIAPFCTHGGGGASSTFTDMKKLAPKADVKTGFAVYESGSPKTTPNKIQDWLKEINLK